MRQSAGDTAARLELIARTLKRRGNYGCNEENPAKDLGSTQAAAIAERALVGRRWLAYLNLRYFRLRWLTKPNLPD
jgi:hypothetical protein